MITLDTLSQYALDIMELTEDSLFLTGKAGTGKTTLLNHFLSTTKKKVVVLASTGVAAIHIGGQTIHSFFRFDNYVSLDSVDTLTGKNMKILYEADVIVIDEVSMVRADLMDCVDFAMRGSLDIDAPFGGKQMIFVGDLYQLPPVVGNDESQYFRSQYQSAYFFASKAYQELQPHVVSLQTIHRQKDSNFAHTLNKIRIGLHSREDLDWLNSRRGVSYPDHAIYLTTTNIQASDINQQRLDELEGEEHSFEATVNGAISASMFPNATMLNFKIGSQIMMLKNSKGYNNGSIGIIKDYDSELQEVVIEIDEKEFVITPHMRQVFKPEYDKELQQIIPIAVGSFKQFPFKLARAITTHKAQGLTFNHVVVDLSSGSFAEGQSYVALSRATSLEGLYLTSHIRHSDIIVDSKVQAFMHASLREQSQFIIQTACQEDQLVSFVYNDPSEGPRIAIVKPEAFGDLEFMTHSFKGLIGEEAGERRAYSYGRIYDLMFAEKVNS